LFLREGEREEREGIDKDLEDEKEDDDEEEEEEVDEDEDEDEDEECDLIALASEMVNSSSRGCSLGNFACNTSMDSSHISATPMKSSDRRFKIDC